MSVYYFRIWTLTKLDRIYYSIVGPSRFSANQSALVRNFEGVVSAVCDLMSLSCRTFHPLLSELSTYFHGKATLRVDLEEQPYLYSHSTG